MRDHDHEERISQALEPLLFNDYEVTFNEDRLGLTFRSHVEEDSSESQTMHTIVKSTSELASRVNEGDILISVNGQNVVNLDFRDVRRILKIAARPIQLRFRRLPVRNPSLKSLQSDDCDCVSDVAHASNSSSSSSSCSSGEDERDLQLSNFILPSEPPEDRDDLDSQHAVRSENFDDGESSRTTENSSIMTDLTDVDYHYAHHASSFTSFLRKPFRGETRAAVSNDRFGVIPDPPRIELSAESPSKAAVYVYWKQHPQAVASQVQYARDRTMRVWKHWVGRIRRSMRSDHELMTHIFGLNSGKSYVFRIRYEFDRSGNASGEWSFPSSSIVSAAPARSEVVRVAS